MRSRQLLLAITYIVVVFILTEILYLASLDCLDCPGGNIVILNAHSYHDSSITDMWTKLVHRVEIQPFNLVSLIIFVCAITHTLFVAKIHHLSEQMRQRNIRNKLEVVDTFGVEIIRFLGEVEVIFGLWVIPLLIAITMTYNWRSAINYLTSCDYTEPLFVVVIMALAATRPIVKMAEDTVKYIAGFRIESVQSWWWTILTLGPISGSLVTEPGAMTICAILLGKQFYSLKPSSKLAYGTLGLLFVNISVGGVLTSFAAPPVLMVSKAWGWDSTFMMYHFGLKAVLGIITANTLYYFIFRKELAELDKKRKQLVKEGKTIKEEEASIPFWISLTHVTFLAWIVVHSHYPVIFVGSFLLFLGFQKATSRYQTDLNLKTPILVGLFLAGLVVHGTLQEWWITPILGNVGEGMLMMLSTILTAFNDNAEITFLATLIPDFSENLRYIIVAGAVTGGGLTVIANAPNPLGQSILGKYFGNEIHPVKLFLGALAPTLIMAAYFFFVRMH